MGSINKDETEKIVQSNLDNIKIEEIRKGTHKYKIKSYVYFIIVLALLLLVFVFLGGIGNDFFGLMIFLIMMILPVLMLFRNKLPSVMPEFLANSLFEIDFSEEQNLSPYSISLRNQQYAKIFSVTVLIIGGLVLIADYRNKIADKMSFYKIMGSLGCLIMAGIILSDVTGEDLSLTSNKEDAKMAAQEANWNKSDKEIRLEGKAQKLEQRALDRSVELNLKANRKRAKI